MDCKFWTLSAQKMHMQWYLFDFCCHYLQHPRKLELAKGKITRQVQAREDQHRWANTGELGGNIGKKEAKWKKL